MSARICRHRTAQRAPGQSGGTLAGGSCGCCVRARGHSHSTRVCSMKAWRFVSSPRPRAGWRATPRNDRASAGSRCSPAPGPTLLPPVHPMCAGLSPAIRVASHTHRRSAKSAGARPGRANAPGNIADDAEASSRRRHDRLRSRAYRLASLPAAAGQFKLHVCRPRRSGAVGTISNEKYPP